MGGDTTKQALTRLTHLPDREASKNGDLIAGQNHWDVYFTGGSIAEVDLTGATITNSDIIGGTITDAVFQSIQFDINAPQVTQAGQIGYSGSKYALEVATGIGATLQVGYENWRLVYNDTGVDIMDGKVIHPVGGATSGVPHVELAQADVNTNFDRAVWVTTMVIPVGTIGIATVNGDVNGLNTDIFDVGDTLYLSATSAGGVTNIRPEFPNYSIQIGGVAVSDISDGVILVEIGNENPINTTTNFWNGTFREPFDFLITSDGATITGSLAPADGHPDMTMMFSDGFTMFDTDPAQTITLTAGTDTNPQTNYVYIPQSTKILTASTAGFPVDQHIKVGQSALQTAATTLANGALRNQNINDYIESIDSFQGLLPEITERIREFNASWDSGVAATLSGTTTDVYISTTGGKVYQLHKQDFPAQDMSTGDDINVVNDPVTPYRTTTNLNDMDAFSDGAAWNNEWSNIVIWGVQNKTGELSHLMVNLPSAGYAQEASAITDALNYSDISIPAQFKGVGFLIARFTVRVSGAVFTYNGGEAYKDLRGFEPSISGGAGGGSGGVTEFTQLTDTPNSYIDQAGKVPAVNGGETALEFIDVLKSADIGVTVQAYDADNAVTDVAQEYTATQNFNATDLVDAATIAWNLQTNQSAKITQTAARTLGAPTNQVDGAEYSLQITSGGFAMAFNAAYRIAGGAPDIVAVGRLTCVSDGTNMDCVYTGIVE